MIHVRSKSDMEAGEYNVKLMTLYDSNQRQSYIRDEIAKKHVLRYVRVPERTVDLSTATSVKTTKLFILRPRSPAGGVEPEILSAYGIEGGERTLQEEFGANELRQKFATRPGRLTNTNVAQPEAEVDIVVSWDNPRLMPVGVYQSVKDGKDLFICM